MCRAFGALPHPPGIITQNVHMPDLAARALFLAVEVHVGVRDPAEQMVHPLIHAHRRLNGRAEHIGHHRHRCDRAGVTQRVIQHRAQVLFELTGDRPVHGPVTGVVRTHGQLIDHQRAIGGFEQFDREHSDHTEFVGDPQSQLLGFGGQLFGQSQCRCHHGHADPVALNGFHDRPGRTLSQR